MYLICVNSFLIIQEADKVAHHDADDVKFSLTDLWQSTNYKTGISRCKLPTHPQREGISCTNLFKFMLKVDMPTIKQTDN